MDGGAWWDTVPGVAKSRTRLSDFTFTFLLIFNLKFFFYLWIFNPSKVHFCLCYEERIYIYFIPEKYLIMPTQSIN